jgi:MEMO1 family protein
VPWRAADRADKAGEVRAPAVAGLFYPADPDELRAEVDRHLQGPDPPDAPDPPGSPGPSGSPVSPKAVIAPHAGYRYSGATAGVAYRALTARRGQVERVVVMGPAHRVRLDGIGLCRAAAWSTPLGDTEVDLGLCEDLAEITRVGWADGAHAPEHSIEVHLPFVRAVFGEVALVPLLVGRASIDEVARVLDVVWGGDETAIVVSSDLSHYLDDIGARLRDRQTATAIVEGRAADVGPHDACGCLPIGGLLAAALERRLVPRLLELSTSADTAGEPSRVVGYGSFALGEPPALGDEERRWLVELARRAIGYELDDDEGNPLDDRDVPDAVRSPGASFVTLERDGELLGCIGSLEPQRALWRDVVRNALSAAFDDPRFPALTDDDLDGISVEVSVLSALEELPAASPESVAERLRPGVDGLVLLAGGRRGTFLPDVWDKIPDPHEFVRELVRKAEWADPWSDGARAWRYTTASARSG